MYTVYLTKAAWPGLYKMRRDAVAYDQQYYKQAGCSYFSGYFLKSADPTAARGTRPPKRTVLKKNLLTTLDAINPAGSFSNVIRT